MSYELKMMRMNARIPMWEVAKALGICNSYLSRVENERIKGSPEIEERIREYLKTRGERPLGVNHALLDSMAEAKRELEDIPFSELEKIPAGFFDAVCRVISAIEVIASQYPPDEEQVTRPD